MAQAESKAVAALQFIFEWLTDSGILEWDPASKEHYIPVTPEHICEFGTQPDKGACDFHEKFWDAWFLAHPDPETEERQIR